jgi:hypothetical protein
MMEQGIQTVFKHEMLRKFGCYFFCLIELAYMLTGNRFDDDNIIQLYNKYVADGAIKSDCTILDPAYILGDLTSKKYILRRPKEKPDFPYYIIENTKPHYTHFTLFYDGKIWDPLDPARATAKQYKPNSYRLLTEIELV